MSSPTAFNLIIIEDDTVDATAVRRAVSKSHPHIAVIVHSTAAEALADPLLAEDSHHNCLVIIDINLPGMGGHELVRQLKRHPEPPPMIILTTSADRHDQTTAWSNGVMGYFLKPIEAHQWGELISTILNYWSSCRWGGTSE